MKRPLFEIAKEYGIHFKKLKRLHDDGLLIGIREASAIEGIILSLKCGNGLSAFQRVTLLRNPQLFEEMDSGMVWIAQNQLTCLGDVAREAIQAEQHPHILIDQAASGQAEYVTKLAQWVASVIPAKGCDYHYIAARALLNVKESVLDLIAGKASRAIMKARKDPALVGMSATENRTTRFFQRDL